SGEACTASPTGGGGGGGGGAAGEVGTGSQAGDGTSGSAGGSGLGGTLGARRAASRLALECTRSQLTLIDVLMRRNHVAITGAAEQRLVGRSVAIRLLAGHRLVATTTVGSDGLFTASAALPAVRVRFTNVARYQAS